MRWEQLFDDLEAQLAALEVAELRAEVAEHTRAERGRVELVQRLLAAHGSPVTVRVLGAGRLSGVLSDVAPTWVVLAGGPSADPGRRVLVHLPAVLSVSGLGPRSLSQAGVAARRLDLRQALRALSRSRAHVRLVDLQGTATTGRIERVGRDHLDLAVRADGDVVRSGDGGWETVPYSALATVQHG